ncbi:hypothetical protein FBQ96_00285 [Nitrospirales bacterium NOB]|nr:hypothetical protein [Nitrospira sp. NTP2]MCK6493567.1 hypothetical protein [Nitrospira sp.]MDL1888019.1 hypothetical protein [Nitrospirales bacterium NOB]MEB2337007.1 hypothetical protein [Nitrospirales bacterium]QOJ34616.1 MAG: hypothetical protein HRU82_06490 [Nitrospira sp.]
MTHFLRRFSLLLVPGLLAGCTTFGDVQERFAVCSYDHAWDAALDAVKDRAVTKKDKEDGLIETGWLEIPMPGRTFGALQREMGESKDRSRLIMTVKRLDDVAKVSFSEERQRWAFRGGSRLFGWTATNSSDEVLAEVNSRLSKKLKEHGCVLTST